MSSFGMRIPVREMTVLRWKDGNVVLQLQPVFDSVDPLIIELPEAALFAVISGLEQARLGASADQAGGHGSTAGGQTIRCNNEAVKSPASWPEDPELTAEELDWLARSAG